MAQPLDPSARELPPGADPVAANADSVTPIAPVVTAIPTTRTVLKAGWITGITAALLCLGIRIVAAIFRVDFEIAAAASDELRQLPWVAVLLLPVVSGLLGSLVACIFLGVRRCQRWVFWLGTGVFVLSLIGPLLQPDTVTWPTKVWLVLMHVVTWVVVVPQVARVVGDSDPRVTVSYREVQAPATR